MLFKTSYLKVIGWQGTGSSSTFDLLNRASFNRLSVGTAQTTTLDWSEFGIGQRRTTDRGTLIESYAPRFLRDNTDVGVVTGVLSSTGVPTGPNPASYAGWGTWSIPTGITVTVFNQSRYRNLPGVWLRFSGTNTSGVNSQVRLLWDHGSSQRTGTFTWNAHAAYVSGTAPNGVEHGVFATDGNSPAIVTSKSVTAMAGLSTSVVQYSSSVSFNPVGKYQTYGIEVPVNAGQALNFDMKIFAPNLELKNFVDSSFFSDGYSTVSGVDFDRDADLLTVNSGSPKGDFAINGAILVSRALGVSQERPIFTLVDASGAQQASLRLSSDSSNLIFYQNGSSQSLSAPLINTYPQVQRFALVYSNGAFSLFVNALKIGTLPAWAPVWKSIFVGRDSTSTLFLEDYLYYLVRLNGTFTDAQGVSMASPNFSSYEFTWDTTAFNFGTY